MIFIGFLQLLRRAPQVSRPISSTQPEEKSSTKPLSCRGGSQSLGRHFGRAPRHEHPVLFSLSQHLFLTVSQYGTVGVTDLCSDPLWMI